jgi:RNA polymerase sigma-70 factor (ECF subfamily)
MFHFASQPPSSASAPANFRSAAAYDASLVKRFNEGDQRAFAEIMERYQKRILTLVGRFLKNDHDAEEIAQDTFIRAYRALADFRGDAALSTWLTRIAMNLACNRYWYFFRRQRHNTMSLNQPINDNQSSSLTDIVAGDEPSPLRLTIRNEFVEIVAKCLEQLDPPHRDILRMRYLQHLSYEEIGEALDINFGTVKSRVARARENLRRVLAEAAPEFGRDASMDDFFESLRSEPSGAAPAMAA